MIQPEDLVGEEWAEWYRLTPAQRWAESEKLWQIYLSLGGSLDPEPDTQSPFFDSKKSQCLSATQGKVDLFPKKTFPLRAAAVLFKPFQ